jgi:hypothetical protein
VVADGVDGSVINGDIALNHPLSSEEVKEVVLLLDWVQLLHVVIVLDHRRR